MHMLSRYFLLLATSLLLASGGSGRRQPSDRFARSSRSRPRGDIHGAAQQSGLKPLLLAAGRKCGTLGAVYRGWGDAANITGTNVGKRRR